jgi:transcriptional regulator with XRE-family HTH domain
VCVQPKECKHVGAALAAARDRAGLTQVELAKLLRKPQSFVSNYERGNRRIDVLELLRIVDALKADPRKARRAEAEPSEGRPGHVREGVGEEPYFASCS